MSAKNSVNPSKKPASIQKKAQDTVSLGSKAQKVSVQIENHDAEVELNNSKAVASQGKEEEKNLDNHSVIQSSKLNESRASGLVNLRNSMIKNDEEVNKIVVQSDNNDGLATPEMGINKYEEMDQVNDLKQEVLSQYDLNNNNIFLTANNDYKRKENDIDIMSFHDLIVPSGKNARLCVIHDPSSKLLRPSEIADHYKYIEPTPVINLIGANTDKKGKLMAGLSRAAYNTRAIIIDSGVQTGLEIFCLRKNLTLIGIAPEAMIELPKPLTDKFSKKMLTNGHTHFILLGNNENRLKWGNEAKFKVNFIERLRLGRKGFNYNCKTVGVLLGNISDCEDEIIYVSLYLI